MEITTAILCDFAQVREGLLFVSSGGITRLYHQPDWPLPRPLGLYLGLTVEIGPDEMGKVHEVRVRVVQQSTANEIASAVAAMQPVAGLPAELEAGEAATAAAAIPLAMVQLPALGAYDVKVSVDGLTPRIMTVYLKPPPAGVTMKLPKVIRGPGPPATPNRQQRRHPPGR